MEYKCDSCKHLRHEADGGDGNPAVYCGKLHWSGWDDVEAQEFEQGLRGAGIDIWASCEDYTKNPLSDN